VDNLAILAERVARSTFHRAAATVMSISRAAAPACRSIFQLVATLDVRPVSSSLNSGSGEAWTSLMRDQSASSSSARIIASDVRTP
jgi:hypothetical protein